MTSKKVINIDDSIDKPGSRSNPYVIGESDRIGEKEILVPKYYTSQW